MKTSWGIVFVVAAACGKSGSGGASIETTVQDEQGAPIAGATVTGGKTPATTDDKGKFVLDVDPDHWPETIVASKAGYTEASVQIGKPGKPNTRRSISAIKLMPVPPTDGIFVMTKTGYVELKPQKLQPAATAGAYLIPDTAMTKAAGEIVIRGTAPVTHLAQLRMLNPGHPEEGYNITDGTQSLGNAKKKMTGGGELRLAAAKNKKYVLFNKVDDKVEGDTAYVVDPE